MLSYSILIIASIISSVECHGYLKSPRYGFRVFESWNHIGSRVVTHMLSVTRFEIMNEDLVTTSQHKMAFGREGRPQRTPRKIVLIVPTLEGLQDNAGSSETPTMTTT
jgi:hypothetical protein